MNVSDPECPSEDRLLAFAFGEASEHGLAAHLAECAACRGALIAVRCEERRVMDRYDFVRVLGRGATGEVLQVRDERLARDVALKWLPDELVDAGAEALALREARVIASLSHPHILTVHDAGISEGRPYVVMALAEGGSFAQRLGRGALPWSDACARFAEAARALHLAHTRGVIHCDVKPANLLLDSAGGVQVADFGLSFLSRERTPGSGRGGTPAYLAPELWKDALPSALSDQYSLGVSLLEALSGRRPTLPRAPLPARGQWPRALHATLRRMLADDPAQRFRDLDEVASALEAIRAAPRRRRLLAVAAGLSIAVCAVIVGVRALPHAASCANVERAWARTGYSERLGDVSRLLGGETAELFRGRSVSHAEIWKAQWTRACHAAHAESAPSTGSVTALRTLDCLEQQGHRVNDLLGTVLPEIRKQPALALEVLEQVDFGACAHPRGASLEAWMSTRRDRHWQAESVRVTSLVATSDFLHAQEEARKLQAHARAAHDREEEAEATLWLGVLTAGVREPVRAMEILGEAELLAESLGDDQLRGIILGYEASIEARQLEHRPRALALLDQAQAIFRRLDPDFSDVSMHALRGDVLRDENRSSEALAEYELATQGADAMVVTWAEARIGRAFLFLRQGSAAAANASLGEVVSRYLETYGERSPRTLAVLVDVGSTLSAEGRFDEADRHFERVRAHAADGATQAYFAAMAEHGIVRNQARRDPSARSLSRLEASTRSLLAHPGSKRRAVGALAQAAGLAQRLGELERARGLIEEGRKLQSVSSPVASFECASARVAEAWGDSRSAEQAYLRMLERDAFLVWFPCAHLGLSRIESPLREFHLRAARAELESIDLEELGELREEAGEADRAPGSLDFRGLGR